MSAAGRRALLQHFLGALAYRTQKAVRDAPPEWASFRAEQGVRTPRQLLRHMSDVLGFAATKIRGGTWRAHSLPSFAGEVARFHDVLADLKAALDGADVTEDTARRLLQGPLADAMSHAGQLAMLRRLAGAPVPPENFYAADISAGNLSADQHGPTEADREWFAAEDEPW